MFEHLQRGRHARRAKDDGDAPGRGLAGRGLGELAELLRGGGDDEPRDDYRVLVAHDGGLVDAATETERAGPQTAGAGNASAGELAALAALQPAIGTPAGEETAPTGPNVTSQASHLEEMQDETFISLRDKQHVERVNFGMEKVNFVGRTASVQIGAGQALIILCDRMDARYFHRPDDAQQDGHLVLFDGAGKEVLDITAPVAQLPRRYQVKDLPPGTYYMEIRGHVIESAPPAALQVRMWVDEAREMLDDAAMAEHTQVTDCGDIFAGIPARYSERVTLGKPSGMGVAMPVRIAAGQDFIGRAWIYPGGPYKHHYLGWLRRDPAQTNRTAILRVIDASGTAVAHVVYEAATEDGQPKAGVELRVTGLAPGEYRMVMAQAGVVNNRGIPLQCVAFPGEGAAGSSSAATPAAPTVS